MAQPVKQIGTANRSKSINFTKIATGIPFAIALLAAIINQFSYHFLGNTKPKFWLFLGDPFSIFFTVLHVIWWQWLLMLVISLVAAFWPKIAKGKANPFLSVAGWLFFIMFLLLYKPVF